MKKRKQERERTRRRREERLQAQASHAPDSSRRSPGRRLAPLLGVGLVVVAVLVLTALRLRAGDIPVDGYRIRDRHPHDPRAFCQGLLYHDGALYESTGRTSELRRVDPKTGKVLASVALPAGLFGEGLTLFEDRLIQLTWKAGRAFVYDVETLRRVGEFRYLGEGWGLTHDGRHLIMSNGTATLSFRDPQTFEQVRTVEVRVEDRPVRELNELEYVNGVIYANVWHSDRIARIDPKSGKVLGWIDLKGLLRPGMVTDPDAVLNGIAYDADESRLLVTGKLWPWLYWIEVVPRKSD